MENHQEIAPAPDNPAGIIPKYILDILGKPSLLETEVLAEYDVLRFRIAETVDPKDAIEWIWVADVAQLQWEIYRLRGIRDRIFEREIARGLVDFVEEILEADPYSYSVEIRRDSLVRKWNSDKPADREKFLMFLEEHGVDLTDLHAVIYHNHLDEFTKLEGLIADFGRRRDSVLREIERRRYTVARRLRAVLDAELEI